MDNADTRWIEVLAKANAMLALQGAKLTNRLEQANFLMALGVTRAEAAKMLGVAAQTLRSLAHQAKQSAKRGGRRRTGARDE